MVKIEFIKDFATKKKGDTWECHGMLASTLINKKVAKKYKKVAKKNGPNK
jgi:hypothetical protein